MMNNSVLGNCADYGRAALIAKHKCETESCLNNTTTLVSRAEKKSFY